MTYALRTVLERLVAVSNVVEEVDLLLLGEQRRADAVNWRIAPSLQNVASLDPYVPERK